MTLRSIGFRLTLWYTGLLAGTLVALGAAAYFLLAYSLQRDVDASLSTVAAAVARQQQEARRQPDAIDEVFRRAFGFSPLDPYYDIFDPSGRRRPDGEGTRQFLLTDEARRNASQGRDTYETFDNLAPYPVRVLTRPVVSGNRVVDLVQVGVSLERTRQTARQFLSILAAMLPVALALAGGGGWLLAGRALAPVDEMTRAARRIGAGDLSERLQESGTGDELDRLAQTLNETLGRLDDSFSRMRQFSADASHELQTPLTVLKGEIEVALRSSRTPAEYEATLQSALEEIDRMARLVDGLLFLARADTGVVRIERVPVDLCELIDAVLGELGPRADDHRVQLEEVVTGAVNAAGDPVLLRQLLRNLVDNAIKYGGEGTRVSVSAEPDGDAAVIRVSDDGRGIPSDERDRIFQRFYRAAGARSEQGGGAGLGLSIVRSIVEIHGGTIEATSGPQGGASFCVRLPAA